MHSSIGTYAGLLVIGVGAIGGCGGAPDSAEDVSTEISGLTNGQDIVYDGWDIPATQCTVGGTTMHCCQPGRAMIGARLDYNVFKCARLDFPNGTRTLDTGTQRNGMHSCPFGQVMVGLHLDLNQLLCQTVPGDLISGEIVDNGTQDGWPMHVCPSTSSYAMSGIRADQNRFTCATDTQPVSAHIFKQVGSAPPPFGCGNTTFTLDNAVIASNPSTVERIDGVYYCHYVSASKTVAYGSTHRLGAPSFSACATVSVFGPTAAQLSQGSCPP
jgi:hypothetical protein